MSLLYHSADLLWATRIRAAAESIGVSARPVRSLEMLDARLADSPVTALVVDLDDPDTALALLRRLQAADLPPIRTLAFGPHVAADAFAAARQAGVHRAMARGTFAADLPAVLAELLREASSGPDTGPPPI